MRVDESAKLVGFILAVLTACPSPAAKAEMRVWNGDPVAPHLDWAYETAKSGKLQPVRIVAARNGVFSGKVVVGNDAPIKGLRAAVGRLSAADGSFIPPEGVTLSYPRWRGQGSWRAVPDAISQYDALYPTPAATVTVRVPADCTPGEYKGLITITAARAKTIRVPVQVEVLGWRLPAPGEYQTFVELIESPESVAMEYGAALWSDKHFELIGKSQDLLGQIGNRSVYIPLIRETNFGNEQSMVRWIPRSDGTYEYDFSVMDKYLDVVEKHMGRPRLVVLYVWDLFLEGGQFSGDLQYCPEEVRQARLAYKGRGPTVSVLEGRGKAKSLTLPQYSDPASKKLWQPLLKQLMARLTRRGLAKAVMLGVSTDAIPSREVVRFFADLLPGVPWVHHSHSFWGGRDKKIEAAGSRIAYAAIVGGHWATDRPEKRAYGWRKPWVHFHRALKDNHPIHIFRILGEINITSDRKGFGRLGADFWPVLKDKRGRKRGRLCNGRYPKSFWRNLTILTTLLAPGKDGAIPTARFELLREGVQECEARIFIEQALADEALRNKLGAELAEKAQAVLDARTKVLRKAITGAVHGVQFGCPNQEGYNAYLAADWQELSRTLYTTAWQVASALGREDPRQSGKLAAK